MMILLCVDFFCIAVIEYTIARKNLLDYINFFSPNDCKNNDKVIYKCFKNK